MLDERTGENYHKNCNRYTDQTKKTDLVSISTQKGWEPSALLYQSTRKLHHENQPDYADSYNHQPHSSLLG